MAFGTIYLGETFCSYIALGNYSAEDAVNVTVKVLPGSAQPRSYLGVLCWLQKADKLSACAARRSCKLTGRRPRCMTTTPRHSPALHQGSGMTSSSGRALRCPF